MEEYIDKHAKLLYYIDNNFYDKNTVDDKISKNVLTWNEF